MTKAISRLLIFYLSFLLAVPSFAKDEESSPGASVEKGSKENQLVDFVLDGIQQKQNDLAGAQKREERFAEEVAVLRNPFIPQLPREEKAPKPMMAPQDTNGEKGALSSPEVQGTRDKAPSPISAPVMNIKGLIWNSDRPQAIVNDKIVQVGDTVNGSKILAIHGTGIDILHQGISFTIKTDTKK